MTVQTDRNERERPLQQTLTSAHSAVIADRALIENRLPSADHRAVGASSKRVVAKVRKPMYERMRWQSPLPVGDELFLNGGSNVVRVTLPLSSLVAMGVPMYPDASDRRVTADVTRDPFGAVIAIHLVEVKPSTN